MVNSTATSFSTSRQNQSKPNEADLVIAAQHGDTGAFNHLVLTYQDRLYNLAARILGDYDLAEDITQNTFLTAYLNLPRFRNGSFRSWLYRIATNACYDELRRHKNHPVFSIDTEILPEERLAPLYDFSARSELPETELERHEMELVVQQALDQLNIDHRSAILLVDQQQFDYQQAAEILGIPIGTLKSRLARARQQLHDILNQPNLIG